MRNAYTKTIVEILEIERTCNAEIDNISSYQLLTDSTRGKQLVCCTVSFTRTDVSLGRAAVNSQHVAARRLPIQKKYW